MTSTGPTYGMWRKLPDNIVGQAVFSVGMCIRVPYFGSVLPRVRSLEPGRCEVTAPRWWGIRNHLGTFHAIAACNLAEVAMGMLTEATVPTTHRWIPKEMTVRYLAKATTSLTAVAELKDLPDFGAITEPTDLVVPVSIRDRDGTEVVHADITVWISRSH
ncbi:hotdog fold domain-containing protein [Rhodococcus sp. G-MC3]|uniref:hotdog fold domain-containing protein n=1 Tax=Rhodococcus sp. G-MC3 TaxID=3046209 RepID=UPI0024BB3C85|nr:hotdog fold domain-containing protein [Rhodococcus sp. G-MC3]MDJ0392774.1 hotdog fold domain-containing protein [Rhodococcus sp. G-MC3]